MSKLTCCRDCHYVTNSAQEHDDPFSSTPLNVDWYCTHPERKAPCNETYIKDQYKIDKYCPLKDKDTK